MRGSAHRRSQSTSALARSQPPSPPMANGRGPPRDQEDEAARNYFSGAGALRRTSSRASNEAVDDRGGDSSDGSLASVKPSKQRRFTRAGSKSSLLPTHSNGADDFLGMPSPVPTPRQRSALPHLLRHDRDDRAVQRGVVGDGRHVRRASPAHHRTLRAVARPSQALREIHAGVDAGVASPARDVRRGDHQRAAARRCR